MNTEPFRYDTVSEEYQAVWEDCLLTGAESHSG